jgi:hypothetical protein
MPVDPMGGQLPYAGEEGGQDSGDFARSMLDLINEWRQVEADEEDLLMIEQVSTLVQKLLARNQKESLDAMSGKLSPRLMAQAYGQ